MPRNLSYTPITMSAVLAPTPLALSSTESRALELLATGIDQVQVASALGITESRLSQIISNPEFARELVDARYKNLAKHNETDNLLDQVERKLIRKLDSTIDMVFKPTEIARMAAVVNGMKRRGASNPESLVRAKPSVKLNIPIAVINRFSMNAAGQVITAEVGSERQDLVTMQSSNLRELMNEHAKHALENTINRPLKESDGVRFIKPQGREKVDLLAECGFSVDVEVSSGDQGTAS
jgi:predicted transcriptional regulator